MDVEPPTTDCLNALRRLFALARQGHVPEPDSIVLDGNGGMVMQMPAPTYASRVEYHLWDDGYCEEILWDSDGRIKQRATVLVPDG